MQVPETAPVLSDIIGNADIGEIIDHRLIEWNTGPGITDKFLVKGMPEVVVRSNGTEFESLSEAESVATVHNRLSQYNIPTLPFVVVEHDSYIYAVTRKLHGQDILTVATPEASEHLKQRMDNHWAQIVGYVKQARQEGFLMAHDIIAPNQYMFGRTSVDKEDGIRLVDFGTVCLDLSKHLNTFSYEFLMLTAAEAIVHIELGIDDSLPKAREAFSEAVDQGYGFLT